MNRPPDAKASMDNNVRHWLLAGIGVGILAAIKALFFSCLGLLAIIFMDQTLHVLSSIPDKALEALLTYIMVTVFLVLYGYFLMSGARPYVTMDRWHYLQFTVGVYVSHLIGEVLTAAPVMDLIFGPDTEPSATPVFERVAWIADYALPAVVLWLLYRYGQNKRAPDARLQP